MVRVRFFFLALIALVLSTGQVSSQITSAQTITFDTADDTNLGTTASDGEGGSSDITGVQINIVAINASGTATGATLFYDDSSGGGGGFGFGVDFKKGLAGSTDPSTNTWRGISIKTDDGSEFDFNGFEAAEYNFFDGNFTVEGFKDGVSTGSVTLAFSGETNNIYEADDLPDAKFGDVDEVRIIADIDYNGTFNVLFFGASTAAAPANNAPVVSIPTAPTVLEDATAVTLVDIAVSDTDGDDQTLTIAVTGGIVTLGTTDITFGGNLNASASFTAKGSLSAINTALDAATFTPTADLNGTNAGSISITSNDGTDNSTQASTTFNITAVNDEPSFTKGANQAVDENSGAQTVNGWATAISKGPADETGQTLTFTVTNDNNGLFSAQPAIDGSGNLTYTPAADQTGTATVSVVLSDNGGTDNGGDDTFATQEFTITINVVITAPSVTTSAANTITASGATLNGEVTSNGGATITERGFVYAKTSDDSSPTVAEANGTTVIKATVSGTTGAFDQAISGLTANTGYSMVAYAINSSGTTEGAVETFTTENPGIAFNLTSSTADESTASADLQVDLDVVSATDVMVDYEVTGTATGSGTDYTLANGTLTITAGSSSKNITISSIIDDALDEDDETVILTLSNPTNATLGTNTVHTYTITDNDPSPTISFSSTSSSADESTTSANLEVALSAVSGRDVTVDYALTGTATGGGTDYTLADGTLTITAGNTTQNITIADIIDDSSEEPDETVIVTLSNPTNATLGTNTQYTYTINNNDDETPPSGYSIVGDDVAVNANSTKTSVTFSNAEVGSTYTISFPGSTRAPETGTITSASQEIEITTSNELLEGEQTICVTLTDAAGNTGETACTTVLIDRIAPTTTLTLVSQHGPDRLILVRATPTEEIELKSSDIEVTNATVSKVEKESGINWLVTLSVSGTGDKVVTVKLKDGSANDLAGNLHSVASNTLQVDFDGTPPSGFTVTWDDTKINATEVGTSSFTFSGAEVGTAYNYTIISAAGGTPVTGTGTINTTTDKISVADLSGLNDGTLTLTVTLTDANSNQSDPQTYEATLDTQAPTGTTVASISTDTGEENDDGITSDNRLSFFGLAETGSTVEVFIDGNSIGTTTATNTGEWTYDHSGTALADASYELTAQATDDTGNKGTISSAFALQVDTSVPTVILAADPATNVNAAFSTTIIFSEEVSNFEMSDISITNGTGSDFTLLSSGKTWSFTVTPTSDGAVSVQVPAAVANDAAGNSNLVSNELSRTYDGTAPTVTSITRNGDSPTQAQQLDFTVNFSEAVSNVDITDFEIAANGSFNGASVTSVTSVNSLSYTVVVDRGTGGGTLGLNVKDDDTITDLASNPLGGTGTSNGDFTTGETYLVNDAPTIVSTPVTRVEVGKAYEYLIQTNDADGNPVTVEATTLPDWLSLDNIDEGFTTAAAGISAYEAGHSGWGNLGDVDAIAGAASFRSLDGLAIDDADNVYIANPEGHTIRKLSADGSVTTFAGSGSPGHQNGTGKNASFNTPRGIAIDASNNLYVADEGNHVIRKITPDGVVTTFAGTGILGFEHGEATSASFNHPINVAVDASNNVYVSDRGNHVIRKISEGWVSVFAGSGVAGSNDGSGFEASFNRVYGMDFDSQGNLFVADTFNGKIRKITPEGEVSTFAGSGPFDSSTSFETEDGIGTEASFWEPYDLVIDEYDNIYVGEWPQSIRKITPESVVTTILRANFGSDEGPGGAIDFTNINGLVVDRSGNLIVADGGENRKIRRVTTTPQYRLSATTLGSVGEHEVVLKASDGFEGGSAEQRFTIKVGNTLNIDPAEHIDFETVPWNTTVTRTLMLTNNGSEIIQPINVSVHNHQGLFGKERFGFEVSEAAPIAPGETITLTVSFLADLTGHGGDDDDAYLGQLTIFYSDGGFLVGQRLGLSGQVAIVADVNNPQPVQDKIKVYPNPATSQLIVDLSALDNGPKEVVIYSADAMDALSKIVERDDRLVLDVSSYSSGMYILHVRNQTGVIRKKFIIKR